jgi:hypothetical protein
MKAERHGFDVNVTFMGAIPSSMMEDFSSSEEEEDVMSENQADKAETPDEDIGIEFLVAILKKNRGMIYQ